MYVRIVIRVLIHLKNGGNKKLKIEITPIFLTLSIKIWTKKHYIHRWYLCLTNRKIGDVKVRRNDRDWNQRKIGGKRR